MLRASLSRAGPGPHARARLLPCALTPRRQRPPSLSELVLPPLPLTSARPQALPSSSPPAPQSHGYSQVVARASLPITPEVSSMHTRSPSSPVGSAFGRSYDSRPPSSSHLLGGQQQQQQLPGISTSSLGRRVKSLAGNGQSGPLTSLLGPNVGAWLRKA